MHKGSLPQPDDREYSSKPGTQAGTGFDSWKVLWRPPGQKHWSCENGITGIEAAKRIEKQKKGEGNEAYRYRR